MEFRNESDYYRSSDDIDRVIDATRLQLQQLREMRLSHQKPERNAELQCYRDCLSRHQHILKMNLSTTRPQSTHPYVAILRHLPDGEKEKNVSPTYVLKLEALLLQAMHMSFLVHPAQQELMTRLTQEYVCEYFQDQKEQLLAENQQFDQHGVHRISQVAKDNMRLYDSYNQRLEEMQSEIRQIKRLLPSFVEGRNKKFMVDDSETLDWTNGCSETSSSSSLSLSSSTALEEEDHGDTAWRSFHASWSSSISKLQDSFSRLSTVGHATHQEEPSNTCHQEALVRFL